VSARLIITKIYIAPFQRLLLRITPEHSTAEKIRWAYNESEWTLGNKCSAKWSPFQSEEPRLSWLHELSVDFEFALSYMLRWWDQWTAYLDRASYYLYTARS